MACGTTLRINCNCIALLPTRLINSVTNGRCGVLDLPGSNVPSSDQVESNERFHGCRARRWKLGLELNRQKSLPAASLRESSINSDRSRAATSLDLFPGVSSGVFAPGRSTIYFDWDRFSHLSNAFVFIA